jgi:hypothetical protein
VRNFSPLLHSAVAPTIIEYPIRSDLHHQLRSEGVKEHYGVLFILPPLPFSWEAQDKR